MGGKVSPTSPPGRPPLLPHPTAAACSESKTQSTRRPWTGCASSTRISRWEVRQEAAALLQARLWSWLCLARPLRLRAQQALHAAVVFALLLTPTCTHLCSFGKPQLNVPLRRVWCCCFCSCCCSWRPRVPVQEAESEDADAARHADLPAPGCIQCVPQQPPTLPPQQPHQAAGRLFGVLVCLWVSCGSACSCSPAYTLAAAAAAAAAGRRRPQAAHGGGGVRCPQGRVRASQALVPL